MQQTPIRLHFSMGMVGKLQGAAIGVLFVYVSANEPLTPIFPWHWGMIILAALLLLLSLFYQEYFEIDEEKLQILKCSGTRLGVKKKLVLEQNNIHSFGVEVPGKEGYFLLAILTSGKTFSLKKNSTSPKQLIEHGKLLSEIFSKPFIYTENTGPFEIKKLDDGNLEIKQKILPDYMRNEVDWTKMIIIGVILVVGFVIMMVTVLPK